MKACFVVLILFLFGIPQYCPCAGTVYASQSKQLFASENDADEDVNEDAGDTYDEDQAAEAGDIQEPVQAPQEDAEADGSSAQSLITPQDEDDEADRGDPEPGAGFAM